MLENELMKALVITSKVNDLGVNVDFKNVGVKTDSTEFVIRRRNQILSQLEDFFLLDDKLDTYNLLLDGVEIEGVKFPVYLGVAEDDIVEVGLNPELYLAHCLMNGVNPKGVPLVAELDWQDVKGSFYSLDFLNRKSLNEEVLHGQYSRIFDYAVSIKNSFK